MGSAAWIPVLKSFLGLLRLDCTFHHQWHLEKKSKKSVGMLGPQCGDSSFTGTGEVQVWESGSLGAAWVTSSPFYLSR